MDLFFIDSLNAITSELESNAVQILTHPKKGSEKVEAFAMQLVQFKSGVFSLLEQFVKELGPISAQNRIKNEGIVRQIQAEVDRNNDKLYRYRLHQILKRKVQKKRRESMLGSAIMKQDSAIMQLEKSVIMIQKDLGIEGQSDSISDRLGLSTVISRSLLGGDYTPARTKQFKDTSMVSELESLPLDASALEDQKQQPYKIWKENLETNFKVSIEVANDVDKKNKESSNQQQLKQSVEYVKAVKKLGTTAKKSKKTVYSKGDIGKEGLLGNLLEQTYNLCQDKQ